MKIFIERNAEQSETTTAYSTADLELLVNGVAHLLSSLSQEQLQQFNNLLSLESNYHEEAYINFYDKVTEAYDECDAMKLNINQMLDGIDGYLHSFKTDLTDEASESIKERSKALLSKYDELMLQLAENKEMTQIDSISESDDEEEIIELSTSFAKTELLETEKKTGFKSESGKDENDFEEDGEVEVDVDKNTELADTSIKITDKNIYIFLDKIAIISFFALQQLFSPIITNKRSNLQELTYAENSTILNDYKRIISNFNEMFPGILEKLESIRVNYLEFIYAKGDFEVAQRAYSEVRKLYDSVHRYYWECLQLKRDIGNEQDRTSISRLKPSPKHVSVKESDKKTETTKLQSRICARLFKSTIQLRSTGVISPEGARFASIFQQKRKKARGPQSVATEPGINLKKD